jgi:hypothetical protein
MILKFDEAEKQLANKDEKRFRMKALRIRANVNAG